MYNHVLAVWISIDTCCIKQSSINPYSNGETD